ncbi:benzoate 4-monooxygenase cytochrome P450 [Xylariaceae sp. FL1651]|nr:benzoate 4-monooxygenase cytochrome P450 [Xylariaceae sp. FL1651]
MLSLRLQNNTFLDLVSALVVTSLILLLASVIYNVVFHPLAHVPGPFWARATGFLSWYHAKSGRRHIWLLEQFRIYGSKIRVEPNTVLFCHPDAYRDIYSMRSNVRRSQFYTAWKRDEFDDMTLNTVDVAQHAQKRKKLNLCFTDASLSAACDFMVRHVDRWLELIAEELNGNSREWSAPVDFSEKVDKLVFDVLGDLCFGKSFDVKEPGKNVLKEVPRCITEYMLFYYPFCRSPFVTVLNWLKPRGLDRLFALFAPPTIRVYDKFVYDSVTDRIALHKAEAQKPERERRHDIFYFLCEARDPVTNKPAYDERELRAEANLLIIAGSDTTAVTLSGIFFYLTGNPQKCDKLAQEILTSFASVDDIVYGPKLLSCTYLKACIDEGMRLTPGGPCELPREVLPGGLTVMGDYYPPGTIVGTAPWTNSRNRDVYGDDAEVFRPERWIADDANSKEEVARLRHGFHPFSSGPLGCIGQKVAMAEMMITIARTLYCLEVRRAPGSTLGCALPDKDQFDVVDAYISLCKGPEVQFRKRRGVA